MDLTNYEEKYAYYGERHATDSNLFWNGFEWQEDVPTKVFDFQWSTDKWLILALILMCVVCGLILIGSSNLQ